MPVPETQEKQLVDWCCGHAVSARCPLCGKNDWTVGELFTVDPAAGLAQETDGEGTSMIQIICDHCKLILLFAAPPILGDRPWGVRQAIGPGAVNPTAPDRSLSPRQVRRC